MQTERTKILFLITKSTWGGAQQYVYDLALSLPDTFEPVVVTGGNGGLIERLQTAGLKVYILKNLKRDISLIDDIRTVFALCSIIRKEKPDVLHINSSKAGVLGSIVGRLCRVSKIIFTAHGWAFNEDRPSWQQYIFKWAQYLTIMLSTKTIAVSEGMRSQMQWIGTKNKMIVIHPGRTVPDMRYKDDARGIIETRVIDNATSLADFHTDFWIGTIAELHPIKRLNRVIDAISVLIKDFPAIRYIIIHNGQLKAQLQQQVKDLGLENHVFFTGTIKDAARLLPAFDLFVLPSKSEAFGYVLIEAGLAGLPVVATEVGGITDIITNMENGLLVPPDDTPALTRAMRLLITDDHLRSQLARAHNDVAKSFTTEKMSALTQKLYQS